MGVNAERRRRRCVTENAARLAELGLAYDTEHDTCSG